MNKNGEKSTIEEKKSSVVVGNPNNSESAPEVFSTIDKTRLALESVVPKSLKEKIGDSVKGVEIKDVLIIPEALKDKEVFSVEITNRKEFFKFENLKKLIPLLGKLVCEIYDERDEKKEWKEPKSEEEIAVFIQDNFIDADMFATDKMYIVGEPSKVSGFYFLKYNELNNKKIARIMLTTLESSERGSDLYGELTGMLLENESDVDGFTALTHTPAFAKSMKRTAKRNGLDFYFGGKKDGDKNTPLSEEDQEIIALLDKDIEEMVAEYEFSDFQEGLPNGYVSFGKNSIPPRTLDELKFHASEPLGQAFKELVEFQMKHRPSEGLYGTLYLVPQRTQ